MRVLELCALSSTRDGADGGVGSHKRTAHHIQLAGHRGIRHLSTRGAGHGGSGGVLGHAQRTAHGDGTSRTILEGHSAGGLYRASDIAIGHAHRSGFLHGAANLTAIHGHSAGGGHVARDGTTGHLNRGGTRHSAVNLGTVGHAHCAGGGHTILSDNDGVGAAHGHAVLAVHSLFCGQLGAAFNRDGAIHIHAALGGQRCDVAQFISAQRQVSSHVHGVIHITGHGQNGTIHIHGSVGNKLGYLTGHINELNLIGGEHTCNNLTIGQRGRAIDRHIVQRRAVSSRQRTIGHGQVFGLYVALHGHIAFHCGQADHRQVGDDGGAVAQGGVVHRAGDLASRSAVGHGQVAVHVDDSTSLGASAIERGIGSAGDVASRSAVGHGQLAVHGDITSLGASAIERGIGSAGDVASRSTVLHVERTSHRDCALSTVDAGVIQRHGTRGGHITIHGHVRQFGAGGSTGDGADGGIGGHKVTAHHIQLAGHRGIRHLSTLSARHRAGGGTFGHAQRTVHGDGTGHGRVGQRHIGSAHIAAHRAGGQLYSAGGSAHVAGDGGIGGSHRAGRHILGGGTFGHGQGASHGHVAIGGNRAICSLSAHVRVLELCALSSTRDGADGGVGSHKVTAHHIQLAGHRGIRHLSTLSARHRSCAGTFGHLKSTAHANGGSRCSIRERHVSHLSIGRTNVTGHLRAVQAYSVGTCDVATDRAADGGHVVIVSIIGHGQVTSDGGIRQRCAGGAGDIFGHLSTVHDKSVAHGDRTGHLRVGYNLGTVCGIHNLVRQRHAGSAGDVAAGGADHLHRASHLDVASNAVLTHGHTLQRCADGCAGDAADGGIRSLDDTACHIQLAADSGIRQRCAGGAGYLGCAGLGHGQGTAHADAVSAGHIRLGQRHIVGTADRTDAGTVLCLHISVVAGHAQGSRDGGLIQLSADGAGHLGSVGVGHAQGAGHGDTIGTRHIVVGQGYIGSVGDITADGAIGGSHSTLGAHIAGNDGSIGIDATLLSRNGTVHLRVGRNDSGRHALAGGKLDGRVSTSGGDILHGGCHTVFSGTSDNHLGSRHIATHGTTVDGGLAAGGHVCGGVIAVARDGNIGQGHIAISGGHLLGGAVFHAHSRTRHRARDGGVIRGHRRISAHVAAHRAGGQLYSAGGSFHVAGDGGIGGSHRAGLHILGGGALGHGQVTSHGHIGSVAILISHGHISELGLRSRTVNTADGGVGSFELAASHSQQAGDIGLTNDGIAGDGSSASHAGTASQVEAAGLHIAADFRAGNLGRVGGGHIAAHLGILQSHAVALHRAGHLADGHTVHNRAGHGDEAILCLHGVNRSIGDGHIARGGGHVLSVAAGHGHGGSLHIASNRAACDGGLAGGRYIHRISLAVAIDGGVGQGHIAIGGGHACGGAVNHSHLLGSHIARDGRVINVGRAGAVGVFILHCHVALHGTVRHMHEVFTRDSAGGRAGHHNTAILSRDAGGRTHTGDEHRSVHRAAVFADNQVSIGAGGHDIAHIGSADHVHLGSRHIAINLTTGNGGKALGRYIHCAGIVIAIDGGVGQGHIALSGHGINRSLGDGGIARGGGHVCGRAAGHGHCGTFHVASDGSSAECCLRAGIHVASHGTTGHINRGAGIHVARDAACTGNDDRGRGVHVILHCVRTCDGGICQFHLVGIHRSSLAGFNRCQAGGSRHGAHRVRTSDGGIARGSGHVGGSTAGHGHIAIGSHGTGDGGICQLHVCAGSLNRSSHTLVHGHRRALNGTGDIGTCNCSSTTCLNLAAHRAIGQVSGCSRKHITVNLSSIGYYSVGINRAGGAASHGSRALLGGHGAVDGGRAGDGSVAGVGGHSTCGRVIDGDSSTLDSTGDGGLAVNPHFAGGCDTAADGGIGNISTGHGGTRHETAGNFTIGHGEHTIHAHGGGHLGGIDGHIVGTGDAEQLRAIGQHHIAGAGCGSGDAAEHLGLHGLDDGEAAALHLAQRGAGGAGHVADGGVGGGQVALHGDVAHGGVLVLTNDGGVGGVGHVAHLGIGHSESTAVGGIELNVGHSGVLLIASDSGSGSAAHLAGDGAIRHRELAAHADGALYGRTVHSSICSAGDCTLDGAAACSRQVTALQINAGSGRDGGASGAQAFAGELTGGSGQGTTIHLDSVFAVLHIALHRNFAALERSILQLHGASHGHVVGDADAGILCVEVATHGQVLGVQRGLAGALSTADVGDVVLIGIAGCLAVLIQHHSLEGQVTRDCKVGVEVGGGADELQVLGTVEVGGVEAGVHNLEGLHIQALAGDAGTVNKSQSVRYIKRVVGQHGVATLEGQVVHIHHAIHSEGSVLVQLEVIEGHVVRSAGELGRAAGGEHQARAGDGISRDDGIRELQTIRAGNVHDTGVPGLVAGRVRVIIVGSGQGRDGGAHKDAVLIGGGNLRVSIGICQFADNHVAGGRLDDILERGISLAAGAAHLVDGNAALLSGTFALGDDELGAFGSKLTNLDSDVLRVGRAQAGQHVACAGNLILDDDGLLHMHNIVAACQVAVDVDLATISHQAVVGAIDAAGLDIALHAVQRVGVASNRAGGDIIHGIQVILVARDIAGFDSCAGIQHVLVAVDVVGRDGGTGVQHILVTHNVLGHDGGAGSQVVLVALDVAGGDGLVCGEDVAVAIDGASHGDIAAVAFGIFQSVDGVGAAHEVAGELHITLSGVEHILAAHQGLAIRGVDGDIAIVGQDEVAIGGGVVSIGHDTAGDFHRGTGYDGVVVASERAVHLGGFIALQNVVVTSNALGLDGLAGEVILITRDGAGDEGIAGIEDVAAAVNVINGDGAVSLQRVVIAHDVVSGDAVISSERVILAVDVGNSDVAAGSEHVGVAVDIGSGDGAISSGGADEDIAGGGGQFIGGAGDAVHLDIAAGGGQRVLVLIAGVTIRHDTTLDGDVVIGVEGVVLAGEGATDGNEAGVSVDHYLHVYRGLLFVGQGIVLSLGEFHALQHVLVGAGLVGLDGGVVGIEAFCHGEGGNAVLHLHHGAVDFSVAILVGELFLGHGLAHVQHEVTSGDFGEGGFAVLIQHRHGDAHQVAFLGGAQLMSIGGGNASVHHAAVGGGGGGVYLVGLGDDIAGLESITDIHGHSLQGQGSAIPALHGGFGRCLGVAHHLVVVGGGSGLGLRAGVDAGNGFHAVHRGLDGGGTAGGLIHATDHRGVGHAAKHHGCVGCCGRGLGGTQLGIRHSLQNHRAAVQAQVKAFSQQFGSSQLTTDEVDGALDVSRVEVGNVVFAHRVSNGRFLLHQVQNGFIIQVQVADVSITIDSGTNVEGTLGGGAQAIVVAHTLACQVGVDDVGILLHGHVGTIRGSNAVVVVLLVHVERVNHHGTRGGQLGVLVHLDLVEVVGCLVSAFGCIVIHHGAAVQSLTEATHRADAVNLQVGSTVDFHESLATVILTLQQVAQGAHAFGLKAVHTVEVQGVAIAHQGLIRDSHLSVGNGGFGVPDIAQQHAGGGDGGIAFFGVLRAVAVQSQLTVGGDVDHAAHFHIHITCDGGGGQAIGRGAFHREVGSHAVVIRIGDADVRTGDVGAFEYLAVIRGGQRALVVGGIGTQGIDGGFTTHEHAAVGGLHIGPQHLRSADGHVAATRVHHGVFHIGIGDGVVDTGSSGLHAGADDVGISNGDGGKVGALAARHGGVLHIGALDGNLAGIRAVDIGHADIGSGDGGIAGTGQHGAVIHIRAGDGDVAIALRLDEGISYHVGQNAANGCIINIINRGLIFGCEYDVCIPKGCVAGGSCDIISSPLVVHCKLRRSCTIRSVNELQSITSVGVDGSIGSKIKRTGVPCASRIIHNHNGLTGRYSIAILILEDSNHRRLRRISQFNRNAAEALGIPGHTNGCQLADIHLGVRTRGILRGVLNIAAICCNSLGGNRQSTHEADITGTGGHRGLVGDGIGHLDEAIALGAHLGGEAAIRGLRAEDSGVGNGDVTIASVGHGGIRHLGGGNRDIAGTGGDGGIGHCVGAYPACICGLGAGSSGGREGHFTSTDGGDGGIADSGIGDSNIASASKDGGISHRGIGHRDGTVALGGLVGLGDSGGVGHIDVGNGGTANLNLASATGAHFLACHRGSSRQQGGTSHSHCGIGDGDGASAAGGHIRIGDSGVGDGNVAGAASGDRLAVSRCIAIGIFLVEDRVGDGGISNGDVAGTSSGNGGVVHLRLVGDGDVADRCRGNVGVIHGGSIHRDIAGSGGNLHVGEAGIRGLDLAVGQLGISDVHIGGAVPVLGVQSRIGRGSSHIVPTGDIAVGIIGGNGLHAALDGAVGHAGTVEDDGATGVFIIVLLLVGTLSGQNKLLIRVGGDEGGIILQDDIGGHVDDVGIDNDGVVNLETGAAVDVVVAEHGVLNLDLASHTQHHGVSEGSLGDGEVIAIGIFSAAHVEDGAIHHGAELAVDFSVGNHHGRLAGGGVDHGVGQRIINEFLDRGDSGGGIRGIHLVVDGDIATAGDEGGVHLGIGNGDSAGGVLDGGTDGEGILEAIGSERGGTLGSGQNLAQAFLLSTDEVGGGLVSGGDFVAIGIGHGILALHSDSGVIHRDIAIATGDVGVGHGGTTLNRDLGGTAVHKGIGLDGDNGVGNGRGSRRLATGVVSDDDITTNVIDGGISNHGTDSHGEVITYVDFVGIFDRRMSGEAEVTIGGRKLSSLVHVHIAEHNVLLSLDRGAFLHTVVLFLHAIGEFYAACDGFHITLHIHVAGATTCCVGDSTLSRKAGIGIHIETGDSHLATSGAHAIHQGQGLGFDIARHIGIGISKAHGAGSKFDAVDAQVEVIACYAIHLAAYNGKTTFAGNGSQVHGVLFRAVYFVRSNAINTQKLLLCIGVGCSTIKNDQTGGFTNHCAGGNIHIGILQHHGRTLILAVLVDNQVISLQVQVTLIRMRPLLGLIAGKKGVIDLNVICGGQGGVTIDVGYNLAGTIVLRVADDDVGIIHHTGRSDIVLKGRIRHQRIVCLLNHHRDDYGFSRCVRVGIHLTIVIQGNVVSREYRSAPRVCRIHNVTHADIGKVCICLVHIVGLGIGGIRVAGRSEISLLQLNVVVIPTVIIRRSDVVRSECIVQHSGYSQNGGNHAST